MITVSGLLVALLILPYTSYLCLGSSYYTPTSMENIVGDLTLRLYPDETIGIKLKVEGIHMNASWLDTLKLRVKSENEGNHYTYLLNASLLFSRNNCHPINYLLNSNWIFEGNRDEARFSFDISMLGVNGINLVSTNKGRYIKVTRFLENLSNTTISLNYVSIGLNQTTIEGFIKVVPTIANLYENLISVSSEGKFSLKLQLKNYTIEADRCILSISSKFSGSLVGFRKLLETNIELPILDEVLKPYRGFTCGTILKLYFNVIDRASELRYAWIENGWAYCSMRNNTIDVSGVFKFSGDIDRHATEILWAMIDSIRDIPGYNILEEILRYPTKISIRNLDLDLELKDALNLSISGVKLMDIDPYNLLRILSDISHRTPMDGFTLSLEGSSNSTMMVELSIQDTTEGIGGPVRVEGKHRIIWIFKNIEYDKVKLGRVENLIGIPDLTYYEYRYRSDGKSYILKIYTNSTLISDPILQSNSLKLTIQSGGKSIEAFNVSIPDKLLGDIIICLSDDDTYMKPIVSKSLDECWIYLSYTPNMRTIEIVWDKPEFKMEVSRRDANIGDEIRVVGVLRIRGVGLKGENVTLVIDGEPIVKVPVTDDGTFSYIFKPIKTGVMDLWACFSSQGLTYETEKIRIAVSSHRSPSIAIIAATIATVSLTTIFILYKRRSSYLPFLKRYLKLST